MNGLPQVLIECMPIIIAMILEVVPIPSEQRLKDSVKSLGQEADLPEGSAASIENFGSGVASATSVAPTLVAGMATVITLKDDSLTIGMFFVLILLGLLYMHYLGRALHKLTDKVPRPYFLAKRNPGKITRNLTWVRLIKILNLTIGVALICLVFYHHIVSTTPTFG